MSAKFSNAAAGVFAALLAVTGFPWDQAPVSDGLSDDLITPWCRIGTLDSWAGRPCVVPLQTDSADGTAGGRTTPGRARDVQREIIQ